MDDLITRQTIKRQMIKYGFHSYFITVKEFVEDLPSVNPQERTGHCEDCKHFRKLPYHAGILGKCIQHTGFCPKGDWYCADYDPQESEEI